MSFKSLITLLAGAFGFSACSGAGGASPQVVSFPKLGEVRLHQVKTVPAASQEVLRKLVVQLLTWTREDKWQPVRVMVDETHPLVKALKGGPVLELTPEDPALPKLWVSLTGRAGRILLEDRSVGGLSLRDLPEDATLDTSWLPP